MLIAVVLVLEHHIFEGDPPRIAGTRIGGAGFEQLLDAVFAVERHDLVANFLVGSVQADRQVDPDLLAATCHHRHHPAGR